MTQGCLSLNDTIAWEISQNSSVNSVYFILKGAKFHINYTFKLIWKSCEKLCGGDIEVMQLWCSLFI